MARSISSPPTRIDVYSSTGAPLDSFAIDFQIAGLAGSGEIGPSILEIPALSALGASALALALLGSAIAVLRRKRPAGL